MNKKNLEKQKVAIVYDRVNKFGGAERVLLTLNEMFPNAPLYTSIYDKKKASWASVFPRVYTSFLQNIPILKNHHQLLGWLMPLAFEQFKFDEYDLVISVTSEAAKGIITGTNTKHICYMLTPTRYLWSGYDFYLNNPPQIFKIFPFYKIIAWPLLTYLKWWDKVACMRPDKIIAISTEVKKRIKIYYDKDSNIVFPPVTLLNDSNQKNTKLKDSKSGEYFFIHGRFEPYKKLDLVLDAFKKNKLPLIVSGSGSEFDRLKTDSYPNIKFIYKPTDEEVVGLYKNAIAFLMPQEEDFGITAVEAQSFGVPVIAYKKGGSLDTVVDGKTGIFFTEQTAESLNTAIAKFDKTNFDRRYLVTNAKHFTKDNFKKNLAKYI